MPLWGLALCDDKVNKIFWVFLFYILVVNYGILRHICLLAGEIIPSFPTLISFPCLLVLPMSKHVGNRNEMRREEGKILSKIFFCMAPASDANLACIACLLVRDFRKSVLLIPVEKVQ